MEHESIYSHNFSERLRAVLTGAPSMNDRFMWDALGVLFGDVPCADSILVLDLKLNNKREDKDTQYYE